MKRSLSRRVAAATVGGGALLGTLGAGLYVTHRTLGPLHAGPETGSVELSREKGETVTLDPGSYRARTVLTDCGGVWYSLTTSSFEGSSDPHTYQVSLGGDPAPYALTTPPPWWKVDPSTGLGPHHTTTLVTNFSVLSKQAYSLEGMDGLVYDNRDCTVDVTITPK